MKAGTSPAVWLLVAITATVYVAAARAEDSRSALEDDWLFQAGGRPTAQHCRREIASTGQLAKKLARSTKSPDLKTDLAALADLDKQLTAMGAGDKDAATKLYLAIRRATGAEHRHSSRAVSPTRETEAARCDSGFRRRARRGRLVSTARSTT